MRRRSGSARCSKAACGEPEAGSASPPSLISADDGAHLFSERYDREMADVFAMQDEIAAAITAALRVKLTAAPPAQRHMPKLPGMTRM